MQTRLGYDCSRYYSWGAFVLKSVVSGTKTQKKVRNAMDDAREELLKVSIDSAESFVGAWISGTMGKLGTDFAYSLPSPTALQLFTEMHATGGGIPLWLQQASSAESIKSAIQAGISAAYSGSPGAAIGGIGGGVGGLGAPVMPAIGGGAALMFGGVRPGP